MWTLLLLLIRSTLAASVEVVIIKEGARFNNDLNGEE